MNADPTTPPGNTQSLAQHALRIQQHIRIARVCSKLPSRLAHIAAEKLITSGGHVLFNQQEQKIAIQHWQCTLQTNLSAHDIWLGVHSNYSASLLHAAWYRHRVKNILNEITNFDPSWFILKKYISNQKKGVLILSLHNDAHHSLCVFVAQHTQMPVWMIAMPENSSSLYPWLQTDLHRMHTDCAKQMHGGGFLFVEPTHHNRQRVHQKLTHQNTVVSLHDTTAPPGTRACYVPLFDRQLNVPIGAIELAIQTHCPIYFAALAWCPAQRTYHVVCQQLPHHDAPSTLHAYASAITQLVQKSPWAWSGWQWFHTLPLLHTPPTPNVSRTS